VDAEFGTSGAFAGHRRDDLRFPVGLPRMEQLNHQRLQLGFGKAGRRFFQFSEIPLNLMVGRGGGEDGQDSMNIVYQIMHIPQFNKKRDEGQHMKQTDPMKAGEWTAGLSKDRFG